MRTKKGELSIAPSVTQLLSPNLHQLPKEHFGFKDQEMRHRKRYLDLIMNQERREVFVKRARIVNYVRKFLDNLGFLEVSCSTLVGFALRFFLFFPSSFPAVLTPSRADPRPPSLIRLKPP